MAIGKSEFIGGTFISRLRLHQLLVGAVIVKDCKNEAAKFLMFCFMDADDSP
jgi:hypothetical protein